MFHPHNINQSFPAHCLITADGAGAIALTFSTSGITSVAFTTDGSDGSLTLTIPARRAATFPVTVSAAGAAVPYGAGCISRTTTTAVILVYDLATPSAVDLSSVATTIDVFIGDLSA